MRMCECVCVCQHVCQHVCITVVLGMYVICMHYCHSQTDTQEVRKKKEAEYEMLSSPVKGYAGKVMTLHTEAVPVQCFRFDTNIFILIPINIQLIL